jgi:hypothetical protein
MNLDNVGRVKPAGMEPRVKIWLTHVVTYFMNYLARIPANVLFNGGSNSCSNHGSFLSQT